MELARKVVVICEWVLISFFGLFLLILVFDLPSAWNAQACRIQITPNCYPWGGEGPAADAGWSYASKRNYLASGIYSLAVLSVTLGPAFFFQPGRRLPVLLFAVVLFYLGDHLLPRIV
jgi:hypothetical protein